MHPLRNSRSARRLFVRLQQIIKRNWHDLRKNIKLVVVWEYCPHFHRHILAAYITHLCELSGHTTWIKKDLILVEPGEDFIYDAFTRQKDYYAYGHVDRYLFGGSLFGSVSFEIFKKFAIMHFAADPLTQCPGASVIPDEHIKRGPALPDPRTVRLRIHRAVPAELTRSSPNASSRSTGREHRSHLPSYDGRRCAISRSLVSYDVRRGNDPKE